MISSVEKLETSKNSGTVHLFQVSTIGEHVHSTVTFPNHWRTVFFRSSMTVILKLTRIIHFRLLFCLWSCV